MGWAQSFPSNTLVFACEIRKFLYVSINQFEIEIQKKKKIPKTNSEYSCKLCYA